MSREWEGGREEVRGMSEGERKKKEREGENGVYSIHT